MEELLREAFKLGQQWVKDINNEKEPESFTEWFNNRKTAINYTRSCELLNNCLQKGDSAYIYENAIVNIISVLPNDEYIVKDFSGIQFTADKKDLTKII